MPRPHLIATLGYPGSGKTHFAEHLARSEGFVHLNADRERLRLFKNPQYTPEEHRVLFKAMDRTAETLLTKGTSVIYDVNFNKRIHREKLETLAKRTDAEYHLVHIVTNPSVALERLEQRGRIGTQNPELYRPIDPEIFFTLKSELENPEKSEPVIKIDGEDSFENQIAEFKRSIGLSSSPTP